MVTSAGYVIAAARGEIDKMRAAIAEAGDETLVRMSAAQFSKLADLISQLCELADRAGNRPIEALHPLEEIEMDQVNPTLSTRTLAQIERELLATEATYAEAERRLRQAEHDRRIAIEALNRQQTEIDAIVERMRARSPQASKWGGGGGGDVLMLQHEAAPEERTDLIEPAPTAAEQKASSG